MQGRKNKIEKRPIRGLFYMLATPFLITATMNASELTQPTHRFFHVDRGRLLQEGMELELNEHGASRFGCHYWPTVLQLQLTQMDDAQWREFVLESIRQRPEFHRLPSRRQVLFAANSIEEAAVFGREINPRPDYAMPIFEVFASQFWTLDMSWTDYNCNRDFGRMANHAYDYWSGRITNHCPPTGERRPPRLEVLILLPARVGKIVANIKLDGSLEPLP
jgi:hypothetical protein